MRHERDHDVKLGSGRRVHVGRVAVSGREVGGIDQRRQSAAARLRPTSAVIAVGEHVEREETGRGGCKSLVVTEEVATSPVPRSC